MAHNDFETIARFICPKCKRPVSTTVAVPEPSFEAERASDGVSEGAVEVSCPKCGGAFNGHCFNTVSSCEITLDDFGETTVEAELAQYVPEEPDWIEHDTPDYPLGIFLDTYHHTGELLAEHGGEGAHLVNRMVFAQQVSALEAYLSDTLINFVSEDAEALKKLLASDRDLSSKKFTLAEIAADKELVHSEVLSYLRSLVYHNIPKVRSLYSTAAGVDLFDLIGADKERLFKAIEYRHDCVHRNGRDSKGNRLEVFTKDYVQEIADMMKALVANIEAKLYPSYLDDDFPF